MKANIAAIRGDVATHSQNFFIEFLSKHPENMGVFPDYQGKSAAQLKASPKFVDHTAKVLNMLLDVMEHSDDAGALKANASKLVKMSQHSTLKAAQFEGLFATLVPYLQSALGGSCAAGDWKKAGAALVAQMKAAGMK